MVKGKVLKHQRKDFIEGNARYVVQFIMLHNVVLTSEFINKIQKVWKFLSEHFWALKQRCALSIYLSINFNKFLKTNFIV